MAKYANASIAQDSNGPPDACSQWVEASGHEVPRIRQAVGGSGSDGRSYGADELVIALARPNRGTA